MKPSRITEVLDLTYEARKKGQVFNPLFAGAAGIGKSQICQQWVYNKRKNNPSFGFIDLRLAYMEAPDIIGFPSSETDPDGRQRTVHHLPDFWPTEGEGLLLLEEPNRGTTAIMNTMMQLLTDRTIHNYRLPDGWIIAACINPESAEYDVNSMDTALRNRFVSFDVEYDHNTFVEYMDKNTFCNSIQMFVKSGTWTYKDASSLGKDGKYISPRTWAQLNAAHVAGSLEDRVLHRTISLSILGKDVGAEFWKFVHDDAPVTATDLLSDKKKALNKLKQQSQPDKYQGDMIAVTVDSIVKAYGGVEPKEEQIGEDVMVEVAKIINSDQALTLIKECIIKTAKTNINDAFTEFSKKNPDLVSILKQNIKLNNVKK
jgi:alkaline phosphatase D